jgi:hypothetical protein
MLDVNSEIQGQQPIGENRLRKPLERSYDDALVDSRPPENLTTDVPAGVAGHSIGGREVEIVVASTIPLSRVQDNVALAFARSLPRISELPWFGKAAGPIAIVGGGPSLRTCLAELRMFQDHVGPVMGCGSVHDYLVENDVVPDYHAVCDPDEVMGRFIQRSHPAVKYLLASQCHPSLFDALAGRLVYLWHAFIVAQDGTEVVDFRGEPTIPGGDAIVLRAWPLGAVLGHREFHFFGFDLSFPPEDSAGQHAYPYVLGGEEPVIVTTQDGRGKRFFTTPGWMEQLRVFMRMLAMSRDQFKVVIHGDGLVAEVCCKGSTSDDGH